MKQMSQMMRPSLVKSPQIWFVRRYGVRKSRFMPAPNLEKRFKRSGPQRAHEFGDTLRHKFGEFNGLTSIDKLKSRSEPGKREEFLHFKINKEVRSFFMEEIKKYSLLYKQRLQTQGKQTAEEIPKPTIIQRLALTEILRPRKPGNPYEMRIYSMAGETGCGKTYAYMIPIVSNLKDDIALPEEHKKKKIGNMEGYTDTEIRSVIFLPTNELVEQLDEVLQNLSKIGLTTAKLNHNHNSDMLVDMNKRVDVLVTTPQRFINMRRHVGQGMYQKMVGSIRYCVLDEADTLLDRSFLQETMKSFDQLSKMSSRLKDVVIVSSTVSKMFYKNLNTVFKNNDIIKIYTKQIHKISRRLKLQVVDCSLKPFSNSKLSALKQCLYSIYCDNTESYAVVKKVLVFVNEKPKVNELYEALQTDEAFKDYEIYKVTGDDSLEDRLTSISHFNSGAPLKKTQDQAVRNYTIPNSNISITSGGTAEPARLKVLITTDLLSRGINFQQTSNSVLYDIPKTTADLVNRVGRVGRIGLSGRVFILAARNEIKGWITGLPKAVRNGTPLA